MCVWVSESWHCHVHSLLHGTCECLPSKLCLALVRQLITATGCPLTGIRRYGHCGRVLREVPRRPVRRSPDGRSDISSPVSSTGPLASPCVCFLSHLISELGERRVSPPERTLWHFLAEGDFHVDLIYVSRAKMLNGHTVQVVVFLLRFLGLLCIPFRFFLTKWRISDVADCQWGSFIVGPADCLHFCYHSSCEYCAMGPWSTSFLTWDHWHIIFSLSPCWVESGNGNGHDDEQQGSLLRRETLPSSQYEQNRTNWRQPLIEQR